MFWDDWLIYLGTVIALMITPGPSHLLMVSNGAAHGFRRSLATAIGDLSANTLQMLAAGLGIAALLATSGHALLVIKWLGVAYLVWLGLRMIRVGKAGTPGKAVTRPSTKALFLQGFLTSAANPKAIVFFAALFPLFIRSDLPFWPQHATLSITYIFVDGSFLLFYGWSASWLATRFQGRSRGWGSRISGGFMIAAALLLGLKPIATG